MRRQSWLVLAVAVFFGLIAVYLVNAFLSGAERKQEARTVQTTRIAVARVPLQFGARITPQSVQFVDWPVSSVPQGSFSAIEELMPAGRTHVVLRPIAAGEPILRTRLSGEGGRATLSALLPADMRAASIRISDVASVSGFALPGDRVDVFLTRQLGDDRATEVLLHNVRLIAINQNADENSEQPNVGSTATLEVSQADAQKLALGAAVGQLSLVLRSVQAPQDAVQYANLIRTSDLASGTYYSTASAPAPVVAPTAQAAPQRAVRPRPRGIPVEVIRGTTPNNYEVRPYGGT